MFGSVNNYAAAETDSIGDVEIVEPVVEEQESIPSQESSVEEPILEVEKEVEEAETTESAEQPIENEAESSEKVPEIEEIVEETPQVQTFSTFSPTAIKRVDVNYFATITNGNYSIDNLPWGEPGFKKVGSTKDYVGKAARVIQETTNGAYGKIVVAGTELGWVDLRALQGLNVVAVEETYAYVTSGSYSVDSLPYGTPGFETIGSTRSYLGASLPITYKSADGSYWYVETIGWMDARAFGLHGSEYIGLVKNGGLSIDTLPWGTPGFARVGSTSEYAGLGLEIKGSTKDGAYLLVFLNGEKIGWVDARAISVFETKAVDYREHIGGIDYTIDSLPWGTLGHKVIDRSRNHLGKVVTVSKESMNGAYAYISVDGQGLGWIDKRAFGLKGTSYPAYFAKETYSVDTLPWGSTGFAKLSITKDHLGSELTVEGTTHDGSYSLVYLEGSQLGWVDSRALAKTDYQTVDFHEGLSGSNYTVTTIPKNIIGSRAIGNSNRYLGLDLHITKISKDGQSYFASHNGQNIGWIEKGAFGFEPLSYSFYITNGNYSLDNFPWGTVGFQTIKKASDLIGLNLEVKAVTQNGAYLKVAHNGQVLGWIDGRAGKRLVETDVNYTATITKSAFSIDSLPWGTPGFYSVDGSGHHLGKKVVVRKESNGGHYLFITEENGNPLGWIDKRALQLKRTVFLDVGHGGSDPGAVYYGVREKDINMNISFKLQKALENAGYNVIMSRTNDVFIDHKVARSEMANGTDVDIFISVHHNAMPGNTYANGIETYWYKYDPNYQPVINKAMHNNPDRLLKSSYLATEIHKNLIRQTGAYDRGVRRDTFAVLRETAMPAVLLEFGYMSSPTELNKLRSDAYQNKLVNAVVTGVNSYLNRY